MKVLTTNLKDKKDMINATNSGASLKDLVGVKMKMYGYVLYDQENENGSVDTVISIKTDDGFVGSTSSNVIDTVTACADAFDDADFEKGIDFTVRSSTSKNDRTFLTLELL